MGSEGFILGLGALVVWALIGLVVAYAVKAIWKRETLPGWPILWITFVGTFGTLVVAGQGEHVPPERMYRGSPVCLEEQRWDDVIAYAKEFGAARGLRFAGGADEFEGAGLNISLSKGRRSLFRERETTLSVMSDPHDRRKAHFHAITREKLTPADATLAKQFEAGLLKFSCS